jgi:carbamoyltransferase
MLILGLSGGADRVFERKFGYSTTECHDAAAVLLDNGIVVAATEEERLNRIKHTNKAPLAAIQFCLDQYGVCLSDIGKVAVYGNEKWWDESFSRSRFFYKNARLGRTRVRDIILNLLRSASGEAFPESKIIFVDHHIAHAMSAFALSGYDESLVVTIDGQGDGIAGMILDCSGCNLKVLKMINADQSLGHYYLYATRLLGFRQFDEYKVMGLAPYGDPAALRASFNQFYTLLSDGQYKLHPDWNGMQRAFNLARDMEGPIEQIHKDFAAALQESLEVIVMHMLRHYRDTTAHTNLCLAGGVAQNCSLNGKIVSSGTFGSLFIQPASYDSGCAIGAALRVAYNEGLTGKLARLKHVFWGTEIGDGSVIERFLNKWKPLLVFERVNKITERAAELLAEGSIIGWVQGRSEFGPRALGNRSILADPRPAESKDTINAMVKKREGFRPFAPSVIEERVHEFFCIPTTGVSAEFMNVVFQVQPHERKRLGAVTHVDGTARLQVVSRSVNALFWELLDAFGRVTGVPILLNTSFNNNAEPIVDSTLDAITCFLTSGLHYLVIGDYLIQRGLTDISGYYNLFMSLPKYATLCHRKNPNSLGVLEDSFAIENTYDDASEMISCDCFALLAQTARQVRISELLEGSSLARREAIVSELLDLWARRLVVLRAEQSQENGAVLYELTV